MTAAEFDSISKGERTARTDSLQKARADSLAKAAGGPDSARALKPDTTKRAGRDTSAGRPHSGRARREAPAHCAGQRPAVKLSRPPLTDRLSCGSAQPVAPGTRTWWKPGT